MLKEIRAAVNNPLDFKNCFVFFIVLYLLIFTPYLVITTLPTTNNCKSSPMHFSENIAGGDGKTFEFSFNGDDFCRILISSRWEQAKKLSFWLYKPDKSIEAKHEQISGNKGLNFTGSQRGVYRISVHNSEDSNVNFQLLISTVPK